MVWENYPFGPNTYATGGTPKPATPPVSEDIPPWVQAIIETALQRALQKAQPSAAAPTPYTQTQAGAQFAAAEQLKQIQLQGAEQLRQIQLQQKLQFDADYALAQLQGANAKELEQMRQAFAEKQKLQELEFGRQQMFAQMLGTDPVRAVLLATGMGGQALGGVGGEFKALPAMQGAQQFEQSTEQALRGITGGNIDITGQGVLGLPSVYQTARQAQQGGDAVTTLLRSAFGVGNEALGGGVSAEEFGKRIQSVTPTGVFGGR